MYRVTKKYMNVETKLNVAGHFSVTIQIEVAAFICPFLLQKALKYRRRQGSPVLCVYSSA